MEHWSEGALECWGQISRFLDIPRQNSRKKDEEDYPRKPGPFWVRYEHRITRKNGENLNFYSFLTPSGILQVFMGRAKKGNSFTLHHSSHSGAPALA
jgi:hypothetical protein